MYDIIEKDVNSILTRIDLTSIKGNVLITGASGMIGVYLISTLKVLSAKQDINIYAWVRNPIAKGFEEIFDRCTIIEKDITNESSFKDLPKFDYIIHAAGYAQPGRFLDNKIKTIQVNTSATINLIEKLSPSGTFLFVSSSELYSGLTEYSVNESNIGTTNTDHPRACYIESKRCGEAICYAFAEKGLNIKIARLSLAYGPGFKKDDKRAMSAIIDKAINDTAIHLVDDGKAIRTYCYITEVILMFFEILLNGKQRVYNVGGNSQVSIFELAKKIGKIFNKEVILPETSQSLAGSPPLVNISQEKYINEFGPVAFTELDDGLANVIAWQKSVQAF